MESQTESILKWLSDGFTLTPLDALKKFGCFRLGARIYDLKKRGFDIKKDLVKTESGARVAQYYL